VVVTTMDTPKTKTADRVGCGDASEDSKARCDVEVFVTATLLKHDTSDLQICLSGPQPGLRFVRAAW
jgi:hypothetical protein